MLSRQTSTKSKRKVTISQTMASFSKDISTPPESTTKPSLEKIRASIGKPVTLCCVDIKIDENIRKNIDLKSDDFLKLRNSIKSKGILQSILVEVRETSNDYELICVEGHRRILAAKDLNIERVPCILQTYSKQDERTNAALAATIKEELHPLDRAEAFLKLINMGVSVEEIAKEHERDARTVRRYLKMANWPEDVKELIRAHKDIFSTRYLFQNIAQAELSEEQIRTLVQKRIDKSKTVLSENKPSDKRNRKASTKENSILSYFKESLKIPAQLRFRGGKRYIELDISEEKVVNKLEKILN